MAEIDNVQTWKAQLGTDAPQGFDGSFSGIGFVVFTSSAQGGFDTVTEQQVGRGSRVIPVQAQVERWSISGYIKGQDALQRAFALRAAFSTGAARYADPWLGAVQAVCSSHAFDFDAAEYDGVPLQATFDRASLPDVIETGFVAATFEDAVAELSSAGAAIAGETSAAEQFEALRAALVLEPTGLTGAEYTSQVTGVLVQSPSTPTSGVPASVQAIGVAASSALAGELSEASYNGLRDDVLLAAAQFNSPTLLTMLEILDLFVGELGTGALSSTRAAAGETIQAVAVANGDDLDLAARRNREAVRLWFARGEVVV